MQAFILAAGLGTRLRPWTLEHPKALVPVGGVPMLERVIGRLEMQGFDRIALNVHHFSKQILDFLKSKGLDKKIEVSDESDRLLDTGGAIAAAAQLFNNEALLVHNVDILCDADLAEVMRRHEVSGRDISLVTSNRPSTRQLVFESDGSLRGWTNTLSGEYKPAGFVPSPDFHTSAFSGIYVLSPKAFSDIASYTGLIGDVAFPIMDYFLTNPFNNSIGEIRLDNLKLIDIGKPDTLREADALFSK